MLNELLAIFARPEMKFGYIQDDNEKIKVACRYLLKKIASDPAMRGQSFILQKVFRYYLQSYCSLGMEIVFVILLVDLVLF
jgi:hypothetical protein